MATLDYVSPRLRNSESSHPKHFYGYLRLHVMLGHFDV